MEKCKIKWNEKKNGENICQNSMRYIEHIMIGWIYAVNTMIIITLRCIGISKGTSKVSTWADWPLADYTTANYKTLLLFLYSSALSLSFTHQISPFPPIPLSLMFCNVFLFHHILSAIPPLFSLSPRVSPSHSTCPLSLSLSLLPSILLRFIPDFTWYHSAYNLFVNYEQACWLSPTSFIIW